MDTTGQVSSRRPRKRRQHRRCQVLGHTPHTNVASAAQIAQTRMRMICTHQRHPWHAINASRFCSITRSISLKQTAPLCERRTKGEPKNVSKPVALEIPRLDPKAGGAVAHLGLQIINRDGQRKPLSAILPDIPGAGIRTHQNNHGVYAISMACIKQQCGKWRRHIGQCVSSGQASASSSAPSSLISTCIFANMAACDRLGGGGCVHCSAILPDRLWGGMPWMGAPSC